MFFMQPEIIATSVTLKTLVNLELLAKSISLSLSNINDEYVKRLVTSMLVTDFIHWKNLGWGHLPSEAKASKPYINKLKN